MITGEGDDRIVLELDAGGTNLVFNAIQGLKPILPEGLSLPSEPQDAGRSVANIKSGFHEVLRRAEGRGEPVALSFAFPGPADYERGIIGEPETLPGYRGGVPLGPILEEEFGLPVFIRNDGDLFAYGIALYGNLRDLNRELERSGSKGSLDSVVGMTLGSGWGCGFTKGGIMFEGSSGTGMEIGVNQLDRAAGGERRIEEIVSRYGVAEIYREELRHRGREIAAVAGEELPREVTVRARTGSGPEADAARETYRRFGQVLAAGTNWAINILDPDLIVLGGGLSQAWDLFIPSFLEFLRGSYPSGYRRNYKEIFDLSSPREKARFLAGESGTLPVKKVGVARASITTDLAIMLGAYHYALDRLG